MSMIPPAPEWLANPEKQKATDESVMQNSIPDTLYSHKVTFTQGDHQCLQVVHDDESITDIMVSKKMMFRIVYNPSKEDFESIEIIQLEVGKDGHTEKGRVRISAFSVTKLHQFLQLITDIDVKGVSERKIRLGNVFSEGELDQEAQRSIVELLKKKDGTAIVESLLENGMLEKKDIVNSGYRKAQLEIFRRLLYETGFVEKYKTEKGVKSQGQEAVWQYFFEHNEWIFGYGLQYRFQGILQREAHVGNDDLGGGGSPISDFLLSDDNFTTFVELKRPDTPIFSNNKNRAGAWGLSGDLIDGVSQTLEQKASGQIRFEQGVLYDRKGNIVTQNAYDSKVILIIGSTEQFEGDNDLQTQIRKKTFELFRRDSRNIETITYDELYDRASYIVSGNTEVDVVVEESSESANDCPF